MIAREHKSRTCTTTRRLGRTLSFALFFCFIATNLVSSPAASLAAVEESVMGQVIRTDVARIDGNKVGVVLSYERGFANPDEGPPPRSELIMAPDSDPATWRRLGIRGSTTLLGVADVDGDGSEDVALGHPGAGSLCPASLIGNTPCGRIRIFDGPALRAGQALLIAEIMIAPTPDACVPSAYVPSSLILRDIDGDQRAELAFGQLAMYPETCGAVHVFPGHALVGQVGMDKSCARVIGPPFKKEEAPDQFGLTLELLRGGPTQKPLLAVAAPYESDAGKTARGKVSLFELPPSCAGAAMTPAPTSLPLLHEYVGEAQASAAGIDLAVLGPNLLIASNGKVDAIDATNFQVVKTHRPTRGYPIVIPGDLTGDGRSELMFGPWVVSEEGDILLHMGPFAQDTFRGSFLGPDAMIGADRFGFELWSLTDVWNPYLVIGAPAGRVDAGGIVNVSVRARITLVPTEEPIRWTVLGGQTVEASRDWVHVRAGSASELMVQGAFLNTTSIVRIPIQQVDTHVAFEGPAAVQAGRPFVGRVYAPAGAQIRWTAAQGAPATGDSGIVRTTFDASGAKTINVHVVLANGQTRDLTHEVNVLAPPPTPLVILAPPSVSQGSQLELRVSEPRADARYLWSLQSGHFGLAEAEGASIQTPTAGWGPIHVTVVEQMDGAAARVANAQVMVEDLAPVVRTFEVKSIDGIEAKADAYDPGGDPLFYEWSLDGVLAGTGPLLQVPRPVGPVNLSLVVRDDGGSSTSVQRLVNVTSGWVITPRSTPGGASPVDAAIDAANTVPFEPENFPFKKIERIKGNAAPAGDEGGGGIPALDPIIVLVAIGLVGLAKARRRSG